MGFFNSSRFIRSLVSELSGSAERVDHRTQKTLLVHSALSTEVPQVFSKPCHHGPSKVQSDSRAHPSFQSFACTQISEKRE